MFAARNQGHKILPRGPLPVELPAGWTVEVESRGIVITGFRGAECLGVVTVSEKTRGFALGTDGVLNTDEMYRGWGWRAVLYRDAIDALESGRA